jgi:hypothetical protein
MNIYNIIIIILLFLVLGLILYNIFLKDKWYTADTIASSIIPTKQTSNWILFDTENNENSDIGYIYYPGAYIDSQSYAYFAQQLSIRSKKPVFILKFISGLAIINSNKSQLVINAYPNIKNWILIGHSLGGTAAADFICKTNCCNIKGLVLLGSYPSKDISNITNTKVLSIIGNKDCILNKIKYDDSKVLLPSDTNYRVIEGGNHCQFGNYGFQCGDCISTIDYIKQQSESIDLILT